MAASLSLYVAISVGALAFYLTGRLLQNVRAARRIGLPYVITPCLETEALALLLTPILRIIFQKRVLAGRSWPKWCRLMVKDWSWEDKRAIHDEHGDVFIAVSPQGLICYSADAAMGWDVMNRRNEFTKPRDKYKLLEIYGPNVATAEGKIYQHHLRITAPPFGDMSGANDLVWDETLRQTRQLTTLWGDGQDRDPEMDINALTLSVISRAGFGKPIDVIKSLNQEDSPAPDGFRLSFLKAINDTTRHMVAILLFPRWILRWSPRADAALAHSELEKHLRQLLREENLKLEQNRDHESALARGNLLTSVVRNSLSETADSKGRPGKGFTEDEVMGNLFIYLLAGYETTANAILYGLVTLAINPQIQDRMSSELDQAYERARSQGRTELSYSDDFADLEYCYGFMVRPSNRTSTRFGSDFDIHSMKRFDFTQVWCSSPKSPKQGLWSTSTIPPQRATQLRDHTISRQNVEYISTCLRSTTPVATGNIRQSSVQSAGWLVSRQRNPSARRVQREKSWPRIEPGR